jgi:hypothetical protein
MATTLPRESSRALDATELPYHIHEQSSYRPSRHLFKLIERGVLDESQGESVKMALANFFLTGRCFILADGPGVGKGRQLAGNGRETQLHSRYFVFLT